MYKTVGYNLHALLFFYAQKYVKIKSDNSGKVDNKNEKTTSVNYINGGYISYIYSDRCICAAG